MPSTLVALFEYLTFAFVPMLVVVSTSMWVSQNAKARGYRFPNVLGVILALVPIGLLAYLISFAPSTHRESPPTRAERGALTVMLAGVAAYLVGTVGLPPDPYTQGAGLTLTYICLLPISHLVVYRRGYRRVADPLRTAASQLRGR
ncbi:hypothetical protein [Haloferax sp. DFSO60]|uniref:hypothetical protein n=1 Tax=Haloferax sp. DFSO60 TaxID=3388652 RepID=UPI00397C3565